MFETTIAGSLPKPGWLAETNKLWPEWRAERRRARAGEARRDAALAEGAGRRGARHRHRRRAVAPALRPRVPRVRRRHRLRAQGRRWASATTATRRWCRWWWGRSGCGAACTQIEARLARAHTKKKLKITMPGPMTIVDTIADRHYGDKATLAMAFAALLNQEARALEKDGVDVIQFDEPAFNVYMDDVKRWGITALHAAIKGLQRVQNGGPHLLRLRHQGQPRLEGDARRRMAPVRGHLPGARQEPARPGLARVHPLARPARAPRPAPRQGRAAGRDRRGERPGGDAPRGARG